MKSSFRIYFIRVKEISIFSYKFLDYEETITNENYKEWEIPDKYYSKKKETIKISFEINNAGLRRQFFFDLFYGNNNGYLFINNLGKTYQLFFKNIDSISITPENIKETLNVYDTNNTLDRKRILIINYSYDNIKINDSNINLNEILPPRKNNSYSFNYSIYDLQNALILTKIYDETKEIKFKEFKKKNKKIISKIIKIIKELNKTKTNDEYNKNFLILKKYTLYKFRIHLNFPNEILEGFSGDKYIDFEFNKTFSIIILYLKNKVDINIMEYKQLYDYINTQLSIIKNDSNLKGYEKILIMEQFAISVAKFNNINNFINSKFEYYFFSRVEKYSILYYVYNFINNFIKLLKDTDKAYYKLVELDAGISFYKNKQFYSFDLKNLLEIKNHLEDIMCNFITFYNNEDEGQCSFCSKHLKYATINKNTINNIKNFRLDKELNKNSIVEGKKIASKIVIDYFHEIAGHIKFGFNNFEFIESPYKCISDKNIIQTLVPNDFDSTRKNVVRILKEKEKSDSGSFFELIYGKAGESYLKDLIDNISNYWKLIDRADLFLNNLPLLSKYIKYRFIFEHYNLKESLDINSSIEQEIEYMKLKFEENNIDIEAIEKYDKKMEEKIDEEENNKENNDVIKDSKDEEEEEEEEGEEKDDVEDDDDSDEDNIFKIKNKKENNYLIIKGRTINPLGIKKYEDSIRPLLKDYDKYGSEYEKICERLYGKNKNISIKSSLINTKK